MKTKLLFLFAVLLSTVGAWAQSGDMLNTPLTLEAIKAGTVTFDNKAAGPVTYRVNGGDVQTIESETKGEIALKADDKVAFFGDNASYSQNRAIGSCIACSADCYIYGNIMSLVSSSNFATADKLEANYTFNRLFVTNTHLKNHPSHQLMLPATTLSNGCYGAMFNGCMGLTKAPVLPATTLAQNCYDYMFYGCKGLTKAPELPATTLAEGCYSNMFMDCTGLTKAPELPATTLESYCYSSMFLYCEELTEAPELPATTLAEGCYNDMFDGCERLTKAPELPVTTLAVGCYAGMFSGCTGLTEAPELPATMLAAGCYSHMFAGCTGLTKAPELSVTTLAEWCYGDMFSGCTGLTEAPELPATILADYCYYYMFRDCTGLAEAPELPTTTLAVCCYSGMFSGCNHLSSVTCLATDISAKPANAWEGCDATNSWLSGVSATGTFYKHPDMKDWETGISGIPEGWTVVDYDMTGINAATTETKKASATTYDLRGMKSAEGKRGMKIVGDKKILTK